MSPSPTTRKPRSQDRSSRNRPVRRASKTEIRVEGDVVARPGRKTASPKKGSRPRRRVFTAKTADKYELYELSVQSPKEDVSFLARVYRTFRGKPAFHLREDFCGTALLASHWVRRGPRYTAEGFDIDPEPVGWGVERNFEPLGPRTASRCTLHLKDVRKPSDRRPDVRIAANFSYWTFKERDVLLDYFRSVHGDLADDGIFVLDIYGGPDAMQEVEEERKIDEGFTYVWDQVVHTPATGDYKAYIHFRFKDGSKLRRAFRYDWRLWTLPEVRDVLADAGFSRTETYWEGTDEDGESGNGVYRRSAKGENCDAWVTYVVALK